MSCERNKFKWRRRFGTQTSIGAKNTTSNINTISVNEDIIEAQNSLEAFVEEAKRTRLVWALTQDSQLAVWSDEEGFVLPIWSNEQNARSGLATFPGYEVRSYALEAMLEEVFPTLGDQEIMIGLNLDDSMGGMDVSMSELERLLSAGSD